METKIVHAFPVKPTNSVKKALAARLKRLKLSIFFQDFCFGGVMDKLGYKISGRHDWSWST